MVHVHEPRPAASGIAKPFLDALTARCEKMNVGDGLLETTDMGPVAGPQQFQDISKAIEQAKADGARMIAGAKPADPDGLLHSPDCFHRRQNRHADVPR